MRKKLHAWLFCMLMIVSLLPVSINAEDQSESTFNLGEFDKITNTYNAAVGTGSKEYFGLSIGFSLDIAGGESIDLPSVSGFNYMDAISSQYSKVINMPEGKTSAEIADYVRQIKFNGGDAGQEVSVLLNSTKIEYRTFYWSGNQHYYQYIPGTIPWYEAHEKAKEMDYSGRSGYLATITSLEEDLFVSKVSDKIGWLGGTRMAVKTNDPSYVENDWKTWTFDNDISAGYWYWACGPEAENGFESAKFYTDSKYSSTADENSSSYYFNWDRGVEPNDSGNENCLATLTLGKGYATQTNGYSWNDLTIQGNNGGDAWRSKGYFVEYGDLSVGDTSGSNQVIIGSIRDDGDVEANYPLWATNAGITETTNATWIGRPLPSTLTLNSDVTLVDSITLSSGSNIILNLNGHSITAPEGKPAIKVQSGSVKLVIKNDSGIESKIIGANGNDSSFEFEKNGQPAIDASETSDFTIEVGEKITLVGGNGADDTVSYGGTGGDGIQAGLYMILKNNGMIIGGEGGNSTSGTAGDGGKGVSGITASIINNGTIIGGNGGDASQIPGIGGKGGVAIDGRKSGAGTYTDGKDGHTPLRITTISLPDGVVGEEYSQQLIAVGDTPTWEGTNTLPEGLLLDLNTGIISGKPTKQETVSFTVSASNLTETDTKEFTIKIHNARLSAPTNLSWSKDAFHTLSWDAVPNAGSYSLQIYKDGNACGSSINIDSGTSYNASSLITSGGIYTFKVIAISDNEMYAPSIQSEESSQHIVHDINFYSNNAQGSMATGFAVNGIPFTLPDNEFTPPVNKQFKAWNIYDYNAGIKPQEKEAGEIYVFSYLYWRTYTVYAIWEDIPLTITKDVDDISVVAGQSATFEIVAKGAGTLSYQWQKWDSTTSSWQNIDGAIGSVYTIIDTDITNNNTQYQCIVSNGSESVTSASGTLSVNPRSKYTITSMAGTGGTITPEGDMLVEEGTSQSYTIKANENYRIEDVLVDNVSQGAITSYTLDDVKTNHTISVTFTSTLTPPTEKKYTITSMAGTGGTITPEGDMLVEEGTSQSYTIKAKENYRIEDVLVDNVSQGAITSYTFADVKTNHTISVTFTSTLTPPTEKKYTITSMAGTGGTITPEGAVPVEEGTSQSYTIKEKENYHIEDVLVDNVSQGAINSYTFADVKTNHTISVIFTPDEINPTNIPNTSDAMLFWLLTSGLVFTACIITQYFRRRNKQ